MRNARYPRKSARSVINGYAYTAKRSFNVGLALTIIDLKCVLLRSAL
jgi:hypothetical protein